MGLDSVVSTPSEKISIRWACACHLVQVTASLEGYLANYKELRPTRFKQGDLSLLLWRQPEQEV